MKKKNQSEENASSRREMLKKAGVVSAFIAPTIVSFSIPNLAHAASPGDGTDPAPPGPPPGLE